jgi:ferredoxin
MDGPFTLIYFSPTGTTRVIVEAIAEGMGKGTAPVARIDLTPLRARTGRMPGVGGGLAIIGIPVYTGRVPLQAVEPLKRLDSGGAAAILVAVYGNRAYEDALIELADTTAEAGFVPVAAAAFIGEHSFSGEAVPLAPGRPDKADIAKAVAFGGMLRQRMENGTLLTGAGALDVPGNRPYRDRATLGATPETAGDLCTGCATCVGLCPQEAIRLEDGKAVTDKDACIICCACVKGCPTGARQLADAGLMAIVDKLRVLCRDRKEPELFLPG